MILEGETLTAAGTVTILEGEPPFYFDGIDNYPPNLTSEGIELDTPDVYKEFLLRGYDYGHSFRGIFKASNSGDRGTLHWTGNWVTFLDSLLQMTILVERTDTLRLPTRLRYIRIDPVRHAKSIVEESNCGGGIYCELQCVTSPQILGKMF